MPANANQRFRVTVNRDRVFEADAGVSLLAALRAQSIFLPSACGGRGICGFCKCTVTDGGGPVQTAETARLKSAELQAGLRLACQVAIRSDLRVEIPEALFQYKAFATQVAEITGLTHDTKRIRLRLVQPREIQFKAGQYVQVQSNPYPGVSQVVMRSYSIASPPQESGALDLIIRRVPNGICTTWIHDHLGIGDKVAVVGPMGDFYIRDGEGEVLLVAGGSGMGPMVSILQDLIRRGSDRKVTYFFGAVCRRDLYYLDEMDAVGSQLPGFTFIPALSQPESGDLWEGATGLITEPLGAYLKTIDTSGVQAYLCGSPGMIQACSTELREQGIGGDRTFFDPFV